MAPKENIGHSVIGFTPFHTQILNAPNRVTIKKTELSILLATSRTSSRWLRKVYKNGILHYNWSMSAHASQAFSTSSGQSCRSGCLIHNGTYLTLSLTLTITLTLLTLTVTVRITLTLLTLLTLMLDTVVNKAPTSAG